MNRHLDQPVVTKGAPISADTPVILAFHGRGQSPDFVIDIFDRWQWQAASLVAPSAAENSWYPGKFMAPIETNEPLLTDALAVVDHHVTRLLEQGVKRENLLLLGFSQGACLIAEYGIRNPQRFRGMAILTGGVIGPEGTTWEYAGRFDQTPVLVTTGSEDAWVPVGRVRETTAVYQAKGAAVTEKIFVGRDHIVSDEEIQIMRELFG